MRVKENMNVQEKPISKEEVEEVLFLCKKLQKFAFKKYWWETPICHMTKNKNRIWIDQRDLDLLVDLKKKGGQTSKNQ